MYSALDISKYIISYEHSKNREVSNLRLQKLLYFVQAKFLRETGKPCFLDTMEAWDFGPVVVSVYHEYKIYGGLDITFSVQVPKIDSSSIMLLNNILDYVADYPTWQLVDITHEQKPWIDARNNIDKTITVDAMKSFFCKK